MKPSTWANTFFFPSLLSFFFLLPFFFSLAIFFHLLLQQNTISAKIHLDSRKPNRVWVLGIFKIILIFYWVIFFFLFSFCFVLFYFSSQSFLFWNPGRSGRRHRALASPSWPISVMPFGSFPTILGGSLRFESPHRQSGVCDTSNSFLLCSYFIF